MATRQLPDRCLLRQLLDYDPTTGEFTWKRRARQMFPDERIFKIWNTRYAGKKAGSIDDRGYIHIGVHDTPYLAHRLAWLYQHGVPVPVGIDHVDDNPGNNRIDNLRAATQQQNSWNSRMQKHNKLGVKGVCRDRKRFRAQIKVNGKIMRLGMFDTIEDAAKAYREAATTYFGEFARTSR